MDDLLYLATVLLALVAFVGLVRACDRIVGSSGSAGSTGEDHRDRGER